MDSVAVPWPDGFPLWEHMWTEDWERTEIWAGFLLAAGLGTVAQSL